MNILRIFALVVLGLVTNSFARAADAVVRRTWTVDGVVREALVYASPAAKTAATPVVFGFHGHGGSMQTASRNFGYQTVWPEAIVVYMQGLDTPASIRPANRPGGRPEWATRETAT